MKEKIKRISMLTIMLGLPLTGLTAGVSDEQNAVDVVNQYYSFVNTHKLKDAYMLWDNNGKNSGKSFKAFSEGYADTESVKLLTFPKKARMEGAAGSTFITLPVKLESKGKNGEHSWFTGTYVLRKKNAIRDSGWKIYSAQLKRNF